MQPILNLHTWVSLPNEVRFKIRSIFHIPQSGNVFVNDGKIETDGTTPQDFKSLTVEKMQEYLSSDVTDFHKLFDMVLEKVNNEINKTNIPTAQIQEQPKESLPIKETTNVKKSAKKGSKK